MTIPNFEFDKKRFETFFDAIIAIILTILVLELRVPETSHAEHVNTRQQVASMLHSFISYIGSFLLIVGIWIDHHLLFQNLEKLTKRYILLNMLFVLSLSIIPFTTAFAGTYSDDSFAVALLFINYLVMNFFFLLLYLYADKNHFLAHEFITANKKIAIYSYIGVLGLIIAIPIAYVNTYVSFCLGIVIFAGHLIKK
jgi:uncharacterized membrane protein